MQQSRLSDQPVLHPVVRYVLSFPRLVLRVGKCTSTVSKTPAYACAVDAVLFPCAYV